MLIILIINMTERRILPARSTRGKRSSQTEQQTLRQNCFYKNLFQKVENNQGPNQKISTIKSLAKIKDDLETSAIDLKAKFSRAANNKKYYPFTRGYHYECDIQTLPRVTGAVSYAHDNINALNIHFSHDEDLIQGTPVSEILNRSMVGLPLLAETITGNIKQKNPCLILGFQNEDKKYGIDRLLIELRHIEKRLQGLIESRRIQTFSSLKKDAELIAVLQPETTLTEKRQILVKKIKYLENRKQAMKNFFFQEDSLFHEYSLNHRLHCQISDSESQLSYNNLISLIKSKELKRQTISSTLADGKESNLSDLFLYENSGGSRCISEKMMKSMMNTTICSKKQNGQFSYEFPVSYFHFSQEKVMKFMERFIVEKLMHESEAVFYAYKSLWKKVFNRNLEVNSQPKAVSHSEFQKHLTYFTNKASKNNFKLKSMEYPSLDEELNLPLLESDGKGKLFKGEIIRVSSKEYLAIHLFSVVYRSLRYILPLGDNPESLSNLIRFLSSDYYGKYHYVFVGLIKNASFGLLHEAIKKATEILTWQEPIEQINFQWIAYDNKGCGLIYKSSPSSLISTQSSLAEMKIEDEREQGVKSRNFEIEDEDKDRVQKRRKLVEQSHYE